MCIYMKKCQIPVRGKGKKKSEQKQIQAPRGPRCREWRASSGRYDGPRRGAREYYIIYRLHAGREEMSFCINGKAWRRSFFVIEDLSRARARPPRAALWHLFMACCRVFRAMCNGCLMLPFRLRESVVYRLQCEMDYDSLIWGRCLRDGRLKIGVMFIENAATKYHFSFLEVIWWGSLS